VIRVLIVEDQEIVRRGLRALLDLVDDVEIVAEAGDGVAALERIRETKPDVLLVDLRMPVMDGIGLLEMLAEVPDSPPAIVLTTFDDETAVLAAIRAGARGFLLKDVSLERLAEGIRAVARGESVLQPALTERLIDAARRQGWRFESLDPPDPLTEREIEVLRLATGGMSNREIAEALAISEGTVKNHVSTILSKLGVRDRTRAVLRALELGLV